MAELAIPSTPLDRFSKDPNPSLQTTASATIQAPEIGLASDRRPEVEQIELSLSPLSKISPSEVTGARNNSQTEDPALNQELKSRSERGSQTPENEILEFDIDSSNDGNDDDDEDDVFWVQTLLRVGVTNAAVDVGTSGLAAVKSEPADDNKLTLKRSASAGFVHAAQRRQELQRELMEKKLEIRVAQLEAELRDSGGSLEVETMKEEGDESLVKEEPL